MKRTKLGGNRTATGAVKRAMKYHHALLALLITTLAACAASGGATTAPSPSLKIDHASGSTDVVLRFEQSGGFMMPSFLATRGPIFTLYGDGTVIWHDPTTEPPPAIGNVAPGLPYQTAKLGEDQVQSLLEFALTQGALGVARERYDAPIADAPQAVFTIDAGGVKKTVSVNGLGIDLGNANNPDAAVLAQLAKLMERLQKFASEVEEQPWSPDRFRGILTEDAFNPPVAWPWNDIQPSDFKAPADPNAFSFPTRTMTPAEVAKLGLDALEGGEQGLTLSGPDGKTYGFLLRPLLPDEAS
jgi:hypothetical protein